MKVYSADEIRFVEEREDEVGTRFIRLMENAGAASAKQIEKLVKSNDEIVIVCGKGKNGGDGFVIARKLYENGFFVKVVLAQGEPSAHDAIENYQKAVGLGITVIRYDREQSAVEKAIENAKVIVDCVFGIGFHGEPDFACRDIFELINCSLAKVISIDVPSGVDTDTGAVCTCPVRADFTLAISTLKPAHVLLPARECCGEVKVLDIGISEEALNSVSPRLETLTKSEVEELIPTRKINSHKNDFGHVLVIAGSRNMPGAACLASGAACVAGAGLTTVAFPESAYASLASGMKEVMLFPLPEHDGKLIATVEALGKLLLAMERATAIVIGPGIGQSEDVTELVFDVLKTAKCPVVIDADGLNAIASNLDILRETNAKIVLTPHPGEMARLTGLEVEEIEQNREGIAEEFAKRHGVTVLLKGAATVVSSFDTTDVYVNNTGNPALSKGGSGDVLSGIIGALLAQGQSPFDAARLGAYLHGFAAELVSIETSIAGTTATDLYRGIKLAYKELGL